MRRGMIPHLLFVILCTAIAAALQYRGVGWMTRIEMAIQDAMMRAGRPAVLDPSLVFLAADRVRARGAQKRGGQMVITSLDTLHAEQISQPELLQDIAEALDELSVLEPELAHVVDLKFFCGFTIAEVANMLGVSERTAQRQWEKARLLLHRALHDS